MRKTVQLIAIILTLAALISLCACSSADPEAAAVAGTYTYYANILDGKYVDLPDFEGRTTTLSANGKGALDWGDDNKGPISKWTIDGEKVVIHAGIAEMDATIRDGILTVDLSDDTMPLAIVFVIDGADTSSMPIISLDEYTAQ